MEVFASIQGEGLYVGEPQVFVRLFGCPLRCRWCDTPGSWHVPDEPTARVALPEGARRQPAWATPFQAATWVAGAEPGAPRTVSVTGGEPLLWPGLRLPCPARPFATSGPPRPSRCVPHQKKGGSARAPPPLPPMWLPSRDQMPSWRREYR